MAAIKPAMHRQAHPSCHILLVTMLGRITIVLYFLVLVGTLDLVTGKPLRLPILLRSPKIECNFTTNECGINQNLDHFELHQNASAYIAGRCPYYHFPIQQRKPMDVARFRTAFFPSFGSDVACMHLEYNVQGPSTFLLVVSQKIGAQQPRIIYSNRVYYSPEWKDANIEAHLAEADSQFLVEVLCQWCSRGSSFSVSRISFSWDSCQSTS